MSMRYRRSPFENLEHLLQFRAQLSDDLLALRIILFHAVTGHLLPGTTDGKSLLVKQTSNLADHDHVLALVVSPVATTLDGFELGELLLPIAKYMGFDPAEFAHFADREITLAWNRRQVYRTTARFQHKLPPLP